MFDKNQLVEVIWANKTKNYYINLGYKYTNIGDKFFVKAKDLPHGSHYKVIVKCDVCGADIVTSYYNYQKNAQKKDVYTCRSCSRKLYCETQKPHYAETKFEQIEQICKDNNYTLLTDCSEYMDSFMEIYYICPKHGVQHQLLDNMIHGHKCLPCSYEERGLAQRYTPQQVKDIIESVNGNILLNPEDYIGANEHNLQIKCGICGNVYMTALDSYMAKNQTRCPHCSKSESVGEFIIRKFLEANNIKFIQEKSFDDCRDKRCLPFDFYLPNYNLIIEFDGKIHYEEVGFGNHEITVKHDKMKNEYCKSHNIDMLRIPYWEGSNIENILIKKLNL